MDRGKNLSGSKSIKSISSKNMLLKKMCGKVAKIQNFNAFNHTGQTSRAHFEHIVLIPKADFHQDDNNFKKITTNVSINTIIMTVRMFHSCGRIQ